MRVIETRMIEAIKAGKSWRGGNTQVLWSTFDHQPYGEVLLHGNCIATVHWSETRGQWVMSLRDAGWQTATTKSRLNALLGFAQAGWRIVQRDWSWRIAGYGRDETWGGLWVDIPLDGMPADHPKAPVAA